MTSSCVISSGLCQIWVFSIRPNMNTNSCRMEKENKCNSLTCKTRSVLHIVHSALVMSFHTLRNTSTVDYADFPLFTITTVLLKYVQSHSDTVLQHTKWPAVSWLQYRPKLGATAERLMSPWNPCSRRRSPLQMRHFLIPISRHAIYTVVGLLQPGVRC